MARRITLLILFILTAQATTYHYDFMDDDEAEDFHIHEDNIASDGSKTYNVIEETADYWISKGQNTLLEKLNNQPTTNVAKNVIMFLGDGLSIPTLAATRAYLGQKNGKPGEETVLSFEEFPFSGLSKTYCVDSQVADSACSATAYLGGVKANARTIGLTAAVPKNDCPGMLNTKNHVRSIAYWSQLKGKRTGLITTTRVTHASAAGVYAHTASRRWEHEAEGNCSDIATQLIRGKTGKKLNVILGGGRGEFLPSFQLDDEGLNGKRPDKRNLIEEWKKQKKGKRHAYVWNKEQFLDVSDKTEYLLGLFHKSHIPFNSRRDPKRTPSLAEMTETAIKILSKGKKGYFLFVEGGRIDHAHHFNNAQRALEETVEFAKAVELAVNMTNIKDTLIVVTSDHSHGMSISGHAKRGNNILGLAGTGLDKIPYATLNYANGLGYRKEKFGERYDISKDNYNDINYIYPTIAPRLVASHAGDDVAIFSRGPWAHLLSGVVEQNVIAHVMNYASCVGNGATACDRTKM